MNVLIVPMFNITNIYKVKEVTRFKSSLKIRAKKSKRMTLTFKPEEEEKFQPYNRWYNIHI